MTDTPVTYSTPRHGSDMGAAFAGLIVGAVALLLLVGAIVMLTNRHYANEQTSAETRHSSGLTGGGGETSPGR